MCIYISPPSGISGASAAEPSTSGSIWGLPKSMSADESRVLQFLDQ